MPVGVLFMPLARHFDWMNWGTDGQHLLMRLASFRFTISEAQLSCNITLYSVFQVIRSPTKPVTQLLCNCRGKVPTVDTIIITE